MSNRCVVCLTVALVACGKKGSTETAEQKPAEAPAAVKTTATAAPAAASDEPSGWSERKGPGFTVKAPNAPTEKTLSMPTAAGPVPATMWTGYEAPGGEAMWAVASEDFTAAKSVDVDKVVNSAFDGLLGKLPGAKIDEIKAITASTTDSTPIGKELRASANLQGHGVRLHVLALYSSTQKHFFLVQALSGTDATLADKFVDSFKLTN